MKQPVVLKVYKGDKLETVRQFEHSQIVIGRSSDVQLELGDDAVALLHAMIEDRGGDYYVSDLGSQSGTYKGTHRVLEDKLNSGDEIIIGPYRIQFFIGVPKPASPPKIPAEAPSAPPNAIAFNQNVRAASRPQVPESLPDSPPDIPEKKVEPLPKAAAPKKKEESAVGVAVATSAGTVKKAPPARAAKGTYAPPAPYKDLKDVIKPHKGSVVEVMVAWNHRVLSTNHFKEKGSVFISSSDDADVMVPIIASASKYELLKIGTQVTVCLTQEMTGELVREGGESLTFADLARQNKLRNVGTHFEIDLRQGEMVRLGLQGDLVSIYVRYVADTPKPLVAPLLDMTSSEVTGIVLALAISAIMALYMNIYTPSPLNDDEARIDEPIRKAIVKFNPPQQKIAEAKEEPKEKKVAVAKDKVTQATPKPTVEKKGDPGKAGEVAPNPNAKTKEKKLTSVKPGGAIKTAPKEGANMKSEKPDPTKVGLLSAFGAKGTQAKLDKAYSGSGELAGMADAATGYAGNAETRDGDGPGTKLKDTGAGGKGSQTIGISGVGTQGRGTGGTGYGTGGIGKKGSAQIHVEGQEGEFSTGMDKEAIRRVIREHLREIRNCYEQQLQRSPDLYGKLVLEWDIEEGGRVSRCVVKSNALGNEAVASCISSHLKTWKFPDPPKDMVGRVSYPFVFSSQ